ncbi:MAG TPA: cytochrome c, partial [Blastocatellia bacterium]
MKARANNKSILKQALITAPLIATAMVIASSSTFRSSASSSLHEPSAPAGGTQQPGVTSPEGAALYKERCAVCHDNPEGRIPPLFLIRRRAAEDVIQTLTSGVMKQQAAGLSADQIRALA